MPKKGKGADAPESVEGKKTVWTQDLTVGRFTAKFPSGKTASAVMSWWNRLPEEFRPLAVLGLTTQVKNTGIGTQFTQEERESLQTERLQNIAAGEFGGGPSRADLGEAFVMLEKAKTADEALALWDKKTAEEKEVILEAKSVKSALEIIRNRRKDRILKEQIKSGGSEVDLS